MWESIKRDLKSPTAAFGVIAAIVSFIWGIYSWYHPNQRASISYRIEQVQVIDIGRIYEKDGSGTKRSPIKILDADGNGIERNVYASSISFWNSGDTDIGEEKVRKAFEISFGAPSTIIDYYISYQRDDVVQARLEPAQRSKAGVTIKWKYLDPKFGFKVNIIYASDKQEEISIDGIALQTSLYESLAKKGELEKNIIVIFVSIFSTAIAMGSLYIMSAIYPKRFEKTKFGIFIAIFVGAILADIYIFMPWALNYDGPPF